MPVLALLEAARERYTRNHSSSESTTPRMSSEGTGGATCQRNSATGLDYSTVPIRDQQQPGAVPAQFLSSFGNNIRQARLSHLLSIKEAPNDIHQPSQRSEQRPEDGNGLGF